VETKSKGSEREITRGRREVPREGEQNFEGGKKVNGRLKRGTPSVSVDECGAMTASLAKSDDRKLPKRRSIAFDVLTGEEKGGHKLGSTGGDRYAQSVSETRSPRDFGMCVNTYLPSRINEALRAGTPTRKAHGANAYDAFKRALETEGRLRNE